MGLGEATKQSTATHSHLSPTSHSPAAAFPPSRLASFHRTMAPSCFRDAKENFPRRSKSKAAAFTSKRRLSRICRAHKIGGYRRAGAYQNGSSTTPGRYEAVAAPYLRLERKREVLRRLHAFVPLSLDRLRTSVIAMEK